MNKPAAVNPSAVQVFIHDQSSNLGTFIASLLNQVLNIELETEISNKAPTKKDKDLYIVRPGSREDAAKIYDGIEKPVIVLYDKYQPDPNPYMQDNIYTLFTPFRADDLISLTSAIIGSEEDVEIASQYIAVPVSLLREICIVRYRLFLQLSEHKYIAVFSPGDVFEKEDFDKYINRNIDELYVDTKNLNLFINDLTESLNTVQALTPTETKRDLQTASIEFIRTYSQQFGWTDEIAAFTQKSIEHATNMILNHRSLNKIWESRMQDFKNPLASHCINTAIFAGAIAYKLDWESELTASKLAFAAMIHDVCLPKNLDSIELQSGSVDIQDKSEQNYFLNHIDKAIHIINQIENVPTDVDLIVQQHHERPDGSGMPKGIKGNQISPLSSVFIAAHDLSLFFLNQGPHDNIESFFAAKAEEYEHGYFKRIKRVAPSLF